MEKFISNPQRKKRYAYMRDIRNLITKEQEETLTYIMYGSFRRVYILKDDENPELLHLHIEKISPTREFTEVETAFTKEDNLVDKVIASMQDILDTYKLREKDDAPTTVEEKEAEHKVYLKRMLAVKIKYDMEYLKKNLI